MNKCLKKYNLINEHFDKYLLPTLMFLSIMFGRDTLLTNVKFGFYRSQIIFVCVFFICVAIFLFTNRKYIFEIVLDLRFLCIFICTIVIGMEMIIKRDFTLMNISVLLCIYVSLFFSYLRDYKYFFRIFVNCIIFLSVYSLVVTYCLRSFVFTNIGSFNIIRNSAGSEFIDLIFAFVFNEQNYVRNFSIFREPAVFSYFLLISIVLEIFVLKRKNKIRWISIVILSITVLSTFSTTGIIILFLICILVFMMKLKTILYNKKYMICFIFFLSLIVILAIVIVNKYTSVYWATYRMLSKVTNINDSSFSRFISIPSNFSTFLKSPLFGTKISNALNSVENNTSTSSVLMAIYGIFGISNIVIWFSFSIKTFLSYHKYNFFLFLLYLLIIFIPFNTSSLLTNLYFYFIPIVYLIDKSNNDFLYNIYNFFRKTLRRNTDEGFMD